MIHNASTSRSAFSMIEMVLVVVIMGIIVAIAAPKFADAESGRKLSSAKDIVERDIQTIKLRARATGKQHIIAFYPDEEMYVCFEGSDIDRDAIVFARVLTEDPINVELSRTNIGGDENIVVSAFGELEKDFTLGVLNNGTEIAISFLGTGFTRGAVVEVDTPADIVIEAADNILNGLGVDFGLDLGLGKSGK